MTIENLPDEIWRDVPGYEGLYEVSNMGRVLSRARGQTNLRKLTHDPEGRTIVALHREGVSKRFSVTRLVAKLFLPPQPDGVVWTFADGDHKNLAATNLTPGTRQQLAERARNAKQTYPRDFTDDQVRTIRAWVAAGVLQSHIAKHYGVHRNTVFRIVAGITYKDVK